MVTWKLLLITLLSAVVLGCVIGVLTGKHQIKKARGGYKPLLSVRERIIYSLCIVMGAVCVLVGVFYLPGAEAQEQGMAMYPGMEGQLSPDGMDPGAEGELDPGAQADPSAQVGVALEGVIIDDQANGEAGSETANENTAEEDTALDAAGDINEEQAATVTAAPAATITARRSGGTVAASSGSVAVIQAG